MVNQFILCLSIQEKSIVMPCLNSGASEIGRPGSGMFKFGCQNAQISEESIYCAVLKENSIL